MSYRKVPKHLRQDIRGYYDYVHKHGANGDLEEHCHDLPETLHVRLSVALNIALIRKVPLFCECSPSCVLRVVTLFKSLVVIRGDYVCTEGEASLQDCSVLP